MSKTLLKEATKYCETNKHRLTAPRLEVLKIISSSKKPIGAYDVLEKLGKKIDNPKPPTAYRAIEFWQDHGFIHRIESLNAFVTCHAGHNHEGSQFMVCDDCGQVEEVHLCHLPDALENKVKSNGFKMARWSAEIHGQCHLCQ
ncbi:MAG: Fur family transcriptional regulator [Bdellovibrionales bacterium]